MIEYYGETNEEYRKWITEKLKSHYRFELISMFSFGEIIWKVATEAAEKRMKESIACTCVLKKTDIPNLCVMFPRSSCPTHAHLHNKTKDGVRLDETPSY